MALLLSLETSTDVCSVALHEGNRLLVSAELHMSQAHASKLAPLIQQVLVMSETKPAQLLGVAVSAGPGSYTGLRIGTSTAKGLCYALGVPLLSATTTDVMARQMSAMTIPEDALLCPMIDARRMEVYCALYDRSGKRLTAVEPKIIDSESFAVELQRGPVAFGGNGAAKCQPVLTDNAAMFVSDVFPSAAHLGAICAAKLERGETEDLVQFEPFYLKDFKAKLPANIIGGAVNKPV